ncbi:MAG: NUDIX hydrolase [Lachnospiraceae bacterium]|jgi:ADP-ribose pyrophosphatase|nr:NUDIX hydrolase [Lachnospiraceae bacterium]
MGKILKVTQVTNNRYLNMYDMEVEDKNGNPHPYQIASRARHKEELKLATGKNKPDGVIIYALYGEQQDRVVLIRQYRYSIGTYIYELPAGLVDEGEDFQTAGIRELKEETGLEFQPLPVDPMYSKPYFTSIGMTDEACSTVYGTAKGEISKKDQEDTEEIEVVLADREEIRRILKEEHVSLMCGYMMMHFLHDDPKKPFAFLSE